MNLEVEKKFDQALELLEIGDLDKARKLGKELVGKGYSGGYEILARCFLEEEKIKDAIKILNEGTQKIPHSWLLWRQLGNIYSDQQHYKQAQECYAKAQSCPDVDSGLINWDRALISYREENFADALELLDNLPAQWQEQSAALKASTLAALKKFDEAIKHCRAFIAKLEKDPELEKQFDLSGMYAELASALWEKERSSEALLLLLKAIRLHADTFSLSKLREIQNLSSDKAKFFNLLVRGVWHSPVDEENKIPGFYRSFQIVADNEEEAFEFTKIFEPDEVVKTMSIEESEVEDIDSPMLKGVYEASGHIFFIEDE